MLSSGLLVAIALGYVAVLFVIAWLGDRWAARRRRPLSNPWAYSLSLAVYCTAWTFYGSVGRAAADGYGFLPIYLGPTLAMALGWVVMRRILRIAKAERLTSIADFLASRYGKSAGLGALVAVIAIVGTVPYIALQLKAIVTSFQVMMSPRLLPSLDFAQLSLSCAGLLAVFAIAFGTRSVDLTEQHSGLVLAIAFESLVKLVAFLAVGVFVVWGLHGGLTHLFAEATANPELAALLSRRDTPDGPWAWMTFVSLLAFWFLPRQFQVAVVENVDERHLRTATWLLPLYLLVINLFVVPIALAGRLHPATAGLTADTYVLALPLAAGQETLAVLVFLGGLSAATGMVIVETLALSNMVANDLVLPLLLRRSEVSEGDFRTPLLFSRRIAILLVLLLGHFYAISVAAGVSLVTIGLISFAAVAQFAPATLGGLYWLGATKRGAAAGLVLGFVLWGYTLPLPTLVDAGWLPASLLTEGPFGLHWLRPQGLLGLQGLDPLSHSLFWSLMANVLAFVGVSSLDKPSEVERRQAHLFVNIFRRRGEPVDPLWRTDTPIAALRDLLGRFLGDERAERELASWARERQVDLARTGVADPELITYSERLLAGTTGAASARVALATIAQEQALDVGEVVELLDETSRVLATSRELAEKSEALEAATAELRRVNERLRELDRLKDDFLSTMAHELRTPLTAIRAFAEILRDNPGLDVARRTEFLRIIAKENERLSRLIHNLLDLARLEGDEEDTAESVVVAEAVRDAVASLAQLAQDRQVQLSVSTPAPEARLVADRDRLVQVVVNLVSNALKFVPEGGQVAVAVGLAGSTIEISVDDDGPGVPRHERETIFDKFRQISRPIAGRTHGTGLGLPISRRIVERHGGSLRVEDSPLGGARFLVQLPTTASAVAGVPETKSDQEIHPP